ncbi:EKC/KEOPS complex subunit Tprkb-like [Mizuhopecten yessoensis]|uniref:TP53RK-binding protein n=1 Tax=Mizuhopecten yessoensis TaxID=6573 RepID=A0A210QHW5_MIZYE|nr:EKC/KEOPS complex subunit Tprkb-like [Mizuhopecten yessoensis]OWF48330.1 TP53RK-binding protein [Mizuhopecten yessoensis]
MSARVIRNELYPDSTVTLALFKNVDNAKELRQCVMTGKFEAALLKTSMIIDPFQVIVAANRAVHLNKVNKMMTKNVHTEILFSLSPTKNISESFRKFGLADTDRSVVVAIMDDIDGTVLNSVLTYMQGELIDVAEVESLADIALIKKIYKITDTELTTCSLSNAIVARISSKDIVIV